MKRNTMVSLVMATGLMLGSADAAVAAGRSSNELSALDNAKTSMEQAITIAQNTTGGKAMSVAFGRDHGQYVYRIRTQTRNGMDRVVIDAANGMVTTVASIAPAARSNSPDAIFNAPEYQPDHS